jgi:Family of unknown function (DUF6114)
VSGISHHRASPGARARRGFGDWRRTRPFWGGLFVLLGGAEILFTVWAPLGVVLHVGMQNFIGYLVPWVIVILGLLLWFNPAQRIFYSLIALLCGLGSFLTSNMGGFLVGLLFTLVGAALAFAWAPSEPGPPVESPSPSAAVAPSGPEPPAQTPAASAPASAPPDPEPVPPPPLSLGPASPHLQEHLEVRRDRAPEEQDHNTLPPEGRWQSTTPVRNSPSPERE